MLQSGLQYIVSVIGNAVTREYEIKSEIGSSGLWRIYSGAKKSTGQSATVFVRIP